MDNFNNIEIYLKVAVGIIGAVAALGKLRETFASLKRKQEIKLDLEILEMINDNDEIESSRIKNIIILKLDKAFENHSDKLTDFFAGIVVFVGFGYWSVDLFQNSEKFNPWIILTLICCVTGLSLIFGSDYKKGNNKLFYKIGFYDYENFRIGLIITFVCGILTGILILKIDGFSFWQFLTGIFTFAGILSVFKNIKKIEIHNE